LLDRGRRLRKCFLDLSDRWSSLRYFRALLRCRDYRNRLDLRFRNILFLYDRFDGRRFNQGRTFPCGYRSMSRRMFQVDRSDLLGHHQKRIKRKLGCGIRNRYNGRRNRRGCRGSH
jgi:hypothetical protein